MTFIYKTMTTHQMINDLVSDEYANWTHEQAKALVEHLEQLADDMQYAMEWDLVAIRCDYCAYDCAIDAVKEYSEPWLLSDDMTEEDALQTLADNMHHLIECDDGSVIVSE